MRNEQRPWVTLIYEAGCSARLGDDVLSMDWTYSIANKGKTPAFDVAFQTRAIRGLHDITIEKFVADFAAECVTAIDDRDIAILFPGDSTPSIARSRKYPFEPRTDILEGDQLWFVVCLTYRWSADPKDVGVEARALFVEGRQRTTISQFDSDLLEFSPAAYAK